MTLEELLKGNAEAQQACNVTAAETYVEPGFEPEALAFREKQENLYQRMIDAGLFEADIDGVSAPPGVAPLLGEYTRNIEEARISGLTKTAHACCIDPMDYETFCNVYKSDIGIKFRGFITYEGMVRWMSERPR